MGLIDYTLTAMYNVADKGARPLRPVFSDSTIHYSELLLRWNLASQGLSGQYSNTGTEIIEM